MTRQADATRALNRDEVSVEKRALGEAANNIFTEERQGAEIVSIRSVLLLVHCVLCYLLKGTAVTLVFSSGRGNETF